MGNSGKIFRVSIILVAGFLPLSVWAGIVINEIMYDPEGSDTNREWVEIYNNGAVDIDITGWKFADMATDGTVAKHILYVPPDHGGLGSMKIAANSFAVLVSDAATFLAEHSGFSGTVIDTTISNFGQQDGRTYYAKLFDKDVAEISSVPYTIGMGAKDDGNSLQLSGGSWIAASPTPAGTNGSATPPPASLPAATTTSSNPPPTNSGQSVSRIPVEPQIFAYINGEKSALTGVETIFKGTVFGLDKKPIENARYVWTFGDGTSREGQSVLHAWRLAGSYVVVLEVGSGEFNASARQRVDVVPANVKIEKVEEGESGFIALKNNTGVDVDLSRWILRSAGQSFVLPAHTIILSGATLPFPNSVTGIRPDSKLADLLFPNGLLANNFYQNESSKAVAVVSTPVNEKAPPQDSPKTALAEKIVPKSDLNNLPTETATKQDLSSSSTTVLYAAVGGSGFSFDWILALLGLVGVGAVGVLSYLRGRKELALNTPNGAFSQEKPISGDLPVEGKKPLKAEDFEIIEERE